MSMKVGIFHIESCEPGAMGKAWKDMEKHDHAKMEFANKFVQGPEVQNGAEATPLLRHGEMWAGG